MLSISLRIAIGDVWETLQKGKEHLLIKKPIQVEEMCSVHGKYNPIVNEQLKLNYPQL